MHSKTILLLCTMLTASACASTVDRLQQVGKKPPLSSVENPQTRPDYAPISWPMPEPEQNSIRTANSLWQPGARAFFRDQRASRVGDILRVNILIDDEAKLDNKTDRSRTGEETANVPSLLGLQGRINNLIPFSQNVDPANLLEANGTSSTQGQGKIDRKERVRTQVAALVTQVMPNGNLVIEGTQEVLVNYEIREVSVKGVIRPQDINSDNTIDASQVAQSRIVYSGRGQLTEVQQPRWGQQVIDIISPF